MLYYKTDSSPAKPWLINKNRNKRQLDMATRDPMRAIVYAQDKRRQVAKLCVVVPDVQGLNPLAGKKIHVEIATPEIIGTEPEIRYYSRPASMKKVCDGSCMGTQDGRIDHEMRVSGDLGVSIHLAALRGPTDQNTEESIVETAPEVRTAVKRIFEVFPQGSWKVGIRKDPELNGLLVELPQDPAFAQFVVRLRELGFVFPDNHIQF